MIRAFCVLLVTLTAGNQFAVMRSVDRTSHLANDALEAAVLGEIEAPVGLEGREIAPLASADYIPPPVPSGGGVLDAHPGVKAAFASFDEAIAGFAQISEEAEEDEVEELVEIHDLFVVVVEFLEAIHAGGDVASGYESVLLVERDVTAALLELREEEIGSLSSVVVSVRGAASYLLWGIPLSFVIAVIIAIFLGTQVRNRRRDLEHGEELSKLYDVGLRLTATIDLDEMLDTVALEARSVLHADWCAVLLLEGGAVTNLYSTAGAAVGDGGVVDLDDLAAQAGEWTPGESKGDATATQLLTPLMARGQVSGVIAVCRTSGFSTIEATVFDLVASQAGLALRNARLYADVERGRLELQEALTELKETQTQLLQAQRLESIGHLAAGIAHEINTPIQYISDNTHFLGDGFADLLEVNAAAAQVVEAVEPNELNKGSVVSYRLAVENADLEFLAEEIPRAVAEVRDGSEQVAKIVSALKDFSRPDSDIFGPVDLNGAIENTLAVTRSEWAEIAEIVLELDTSLPEVPALPGPLKRGCSTLSSMLPRQLRITRSRTGAGLRWPHLSWATMPKSASATRVAESHPRSPIEYSTRSLRLATSAPEPVRAFPLPTA
jgi:signal transduction histidine kinase